ncbi:CBASS cGAMP synthase [Dickeya chrysanthemi]|uniref:CBASS cGAMP synthase n=1 Tax=Dickeya chrysanthemi TaxID=556 RepID=UPI00039E5512|nr:hypothetical protein [Dickeya chrysanthemi]
MTWNFHHYYTNHTDGLIGALLLKKQEKEKLKALRQKVRIRTKDVFEEATSIAKEVKQCMLTLDNLRSRLSNTTLRYLSDDDQREVAKLIYDMDDEVRDEFLGLTPRFWTQGSFQYNTLNRPFHLGQEMDIDDGTYMPMTMFESKPRIGHKLLLLLVDSSLKSLAAENPGWVFEAKQTCARIKIPAEKTHIDVPMYAIPKDEFLKKQIAMECRASLNKAVCDSLDYAGMEDYRRNYEVDSENVNLALRDGDKGWTNSDPKIVEDWFNDSCRRIGVHLREVCRFMKAWRDAQWDIGGPSSISLMAATVNILDKVPHDKEDIGATMKIVAEHLPYEFAKGVDSPDDTDDKRLFPPRSEHGRREHDIMDKLESLSGILIEAESAESKQKALEKINTAFGNRVTDYTLIVTTQAVPAFKTAAASASSPKKINSTMVSG